MNRLLFIIAIAVILFLPARAGAQSRAEAKQVASQYLLAFHTDDEIGMNSLYDRIVTDRNLAGIIENDHPRVYSLIKLRSILRRIDAMEKKYGNGFSITPAVTGSAAPFVSNSETGTLRGNTDNRTLSAGSPNQFRPSNSSRSALSNSRVRLTNQQTVRAYSNQDRVRVQNNQQRLRDRR